MRRLALFLLLLLPAIAPAPARADITAEYYVWGVIGPTMRVQVAAGGNARVEMGGRLAAIRRDGVMYLLRSDARGQFLLREDEFNRIEAQLQRDQRSPVPEADLRGVGIVEAGEEVVAGRRGIVLLIREADGRVNRQDMAFVVSRDADLAPVGEIVAAIFGRAREGFPLSNLIADLHARGTVIRMWSLLRLERTSSEPIPPGAFDLVGPILGGDEARRRLGRAW